MRIGYFNYTLDLSIRHYISNIVRELQQLGADMIPLGYYDFLPSNIDIFWDLRLTGSTPPSERFKDLTKPLVVTLHGGLPLHLLVYSKLPDVKDTLHWMSRTLSQLYQWRKWSKKISAAITPSSSAKVLASTMYGIPKNRIVPIHHGVDHELFKNESSTRSFFLHVSHYQPVKNFDRIIEAYLQVDNPNKPELVAIVPNYPGRVVERGIVISREEINQSELVSFYNRSIAFVFPSLIESFGMPVLEAMACGSPVITSNRYACSEVAGDAAILVNPYSVAEIRDALIGIMNDKSKQTELAQKSILRARQFSWKKSAAKHLEVFESVMNK